MSCGLVGQGRVFDDHRALGAVEADEFSAVVVQVAAQGDAEIGIVVEGFDQVGELAAILEVVKTAGGLRALRGLVDAGDELNAGEQVDEQIAAQAFAVIGDSSASGRSGRDRRGAWARCPGTCSSRWSFRWRRAEWDRPRRRWGNCGPSRR